MVGQLPCSWASTKKKGSWKDWQRFNVLGSQPLTVDFGDCPRRQTWSFHYTTQNCESFEEKSDKGLLKGNNSWELTISEVLFDFRVTFRVIFFKASFHCSSEFWWLWKLEDRDCMQIVPCDLEDSNLDLALIHQSFNNHPMSWTCCKLQKQRFVPCCHCSFVHWGHGSII